LWNFERQRSEFARPTHQPDIQIEFTSFHSIKEWLDVTLDEFAHNLRQLTGSFIQIFPSEDRIGRFEDPTASLSRQFAPVRHRLPLPRIQAA
jgi:hypothetical protein